ncbi:MULTISPECIES: hypothetical protein [unclassified Ensifer]|uniref:hypothetical protein n=1 Tax=unclassified Ensifer TaxID=2633371 RepID=UPI0007101001|nr:MULTISPECIES: hypothetical protein [unclassified Ensifer]KQW47209.1 hypothetical protein ASD02_34460 [Ensifer sp. Root1252]KRC68761.1 hypothetical protein ASE32_35290 [Ensifer sp. Root231]KRC93927.1 hypothetical protein ASE47_34955 [Ensifer sp. Root258]
MLQAIVSGKAGRLPASDDTISWRSAFRMSEDLLTASVFGRLAYFSGPVLWRILRRTFGPTLPDFSVAELDDISFWPTWDESGEINGTVEPDVFLDFKLGDPAISMRLIVEAKFGTYPTQYADQWVRQWTAYRETNGDEGNRVVLAAIGGLGKNVEATVEKIVGEIAASGHDILVVAAGWDRLLTAIEEERARPMDRSATRVLDDIVTALGLAGYQHLRLLGELPYSTRPWNPITSVSLRDFK